MFWGDFECIDDIECPKDRLKYWNASQKLVAEQKKKIKSLCQEKDNPQGKVKTLNDLITYLKNEKKNYF